MINSSITKKCECGCGRTIIIRGYKKNGGIFTPKYIQGHSKRHFIQQEKICVNCCSSYKTRDNTENTYRQFCSLSCASTYNQKDGSWNRGIPHTEIEKIRIGEGVKRTRPKDWINPSTRSEVKEKIRNTLKQKGISKGSNNPNWKGGITPINIRLRSQYKNEIVIWRQTIFKRDIFTCKFLGCNKKGIPLQAHHIQKVANFPELILDINNGITLCKKCHDKTKGQEELFEKTFLEWIYRVDLI